MVCVGTGQHVPGSKGALALGVVGPELEGRCKTDPCERLADLESAEQQPPGLRVVGGGQPSRLGARQCWRARRDRRQRVPDIWPERIDRGGAARAQAAGQGSERREEPPQKQRGSAAVGPGQSVSLHFDVCRMNLFSSNQLTSPLEHPDHLQAGLGV